MSCERYPKKCYLLLKSHVDLGRSNWVSSIRNLLLSLGFGDVWQAQEIGNPKAFLGEFKDRLKSVSMQHIQSRIREKFEAYLLFHPIFCRAGYVDHVSSITKRRLLAMLRLNCFPLRKNLFLKKMVSNDKCENCNLNVPEDENHVLFECIFYESQRCALLPPSLLLSKNIHALYTMLHGMSPQLYVQNTIHFLKCIYKECLKSKHAGT